MHDVLVVDPLSHFLQQPVMPDIVKVGSQIKVEDPRLPLSYCFRHSLDRVVCCPLGPISIRPRLEVRLEHRFEDELERTLHHSVPDRMVEEIITALSHIRWLFVIARNSSFTYKGQASDVKRVGRELGVRYVLEGSVRKGGNRVRITAQLIDAETGGHLWADHFEGRLEDVFDLQDKVAVSVAGVIEPELETAEAARSAGRQTADLTAYDLFLRAQAVYWSSARQIPEALRLRSGRSPATLTTGSRWPGPRCALSSCIV